MLASSASEELKPLTIETANEFAREVRALLAGVTFTIYNEWPGRKDECLPGCRLKRFGFDDFSSDDGATLIDKLTEPQLLVRITLDTGQGVFVLDLNEPWEYRYRVTEREVVVVAVDLELDMELLRTRWVKD